jgi:hypothetical protein
MGFHIWIGDDPKPIPAMISFELSGLNVSDRHILQSTLSVFLLSKLKIMTARWTKMVDLLCSNAAKNFPLGENIAGF